MSSRPALASSFVLDQMPSGDAEHNFTTPTKRIDNGDDLSYFFSSTAYRDLLTWLMQLNRSMFPTKDNNGQVQEHSLDSPPEYTQSVQSVRQLISDLSSLIEQAPPDQGPRRFGNVAFKTWFKLVEDGMDDLINAHLAEVMRRFKPEQQASLTSEVKFYLLGGFGSAQRLDYGTGHELSFLAFLGCLWKLGAFQAGEERAIVVGVVQPYLELIRHLVLTYTLEPAGSHGVWGLDDHSFVPYIFGSAEYGPPIDPSKTNLPLPTEGSLDSAPSPSCVTDKKAVGSYSKSNMYFSAIQFIYDVKRGPFGEHSPVLYDISGIKDGWAKINKGMLKMYAAEVLGKFPVVQHFGFGSLFRWDVDGDATNSQSTEHVRQLPKGERVRSMDVPPAPPAALSGTRAPWANAGGPAGLPSAASMPSTRAPWAAAGGEQLAANASTFSTQRTAAPWTSSQRVPQKAPGRPSLAASRPSKDHG